MVQGPIKTIQGSKIKTVSSAGPVKESNDPTRKKLGGGTATSHTKSASKTGSQLSGNKISFKKTTAAAAN